MGKIITFYSYKGGVGRSMALANVAWLMASKGLKVLVVDWDLEAPGLHRFFNIENEGINSGLIDLIYDYKSLVSQEHESLPVPLVDISKSIIPINDVNQTGKPFTLNILPAGKLDMAYVQHLEELNWKDFYANWRGSEFISYLSDRMREQADIILVDSRTGRTDIAGICTMQIPDIVVLVFTLNRQNIEGTEFAINAINPNAISLDKESTRPNIFIRASRIDPQQTTNKKDWQLQAIQSFRSLLFDKKSDYDMKYLEDISFPYLPEYSYGETPLVVKKYPDERLTRSYGILAKILCNEAGFPITNETPISFDQNNEPNRTQPKTHFVDKTQKGPDIYDTINKAIDAAIAKDTILINPGYYRESLIIKKNLKIKGNLGTDSKKPIIDSDSECTIIFDTQKALLKDVQIRQTGNDHGCAVQIKTGSPSLEDCDISYSDETGIIIGSEATPLLLKNNIHGARQDGIRIENGGGGILEDNVIYGNARFGLFITNRANPRILRNQIHDNIGIGVSIQNEGLGELRANNIYRNVEGGVKIIESSHPMLVNNTISDNLSKGVWVTDGGLGIIEDNEIYRNHDCGVMIENSSNLKIRRNKVYDNLKEGIVVSSSAQATIENNEIYNNHQTGIEVSGNSVANLQENKIYNSKEGGVYVHGNAKCCMVANDIYSNAKSGVAVTQNAEANITDNKIRDNGHRGIYISHGSGQASENDLRNNHAGAWYLDAVPDSSFLFSNNKE